MGIFFCQGEICSAGSRLFVEESIYDEFVARLAEMAQAVKLGHGLDPETKMGPLVSRDAAGTRARLRPDRRARKSASALAGGRAPGRRPRRRVSSSSRPSSPSVTNAMRIAREEIFGPVVCAMPFKDLPDAIAKGNDSPYGLAAGVWTRDIRKAHQAAAALDAGTVWVNCYNAFDNASPWGGFKQSGWGREKGPYGLDLFTQIKSVIVNFRRFETEAERDSPNLREAAALTYLREAIAPCPGVSPSGGPGWERAIEPTKWTLRPQRPARALLTSAEPEDLRRADQACCQSSSGHADKSGVSGDSKAIAALARPSTSSKSKAPLVLGARG